MKDILSFLPLHGLRRRWVPHRRMGLLLAALAAGCIGIVIAAMRNPKFSGAREAFRKAREGEGRFSWEQAAALGEWVAGLTGAVIFLLLLVTQRWWAGLCANERRCGPSGRGIGAWGIIVCIVIIAAGWFLRSDLARRSLWWDEAWNVRYATLGEWRETDQGMKFRQHSWGRSLWYYNKPTNHPPLTVSSRLTHGLTDASPGEVRELAVRMPVILGSLAAGCLAALLAGRWGGAAAGLAAGLMIAVHPWTVRYGVDARGYGLLLPFTAWGIFLTLRMTRDEAGDRLRWWCLFGINQFCLVWSHLLAAAVAAALTVAAFVLIRRSWGPGHRGTPIRRLLAVNMAAAALWLIAFLPNLLQALTWGERNGDGNRLDAAYLWRTLSQITFGMEPALPDTAATEGLLSLTGLTGSGLLAGLAVACVIFLILTGLARLRRVTPDLFVIIASLLCAALLLTGLVAVTGFYFYHRFIVWVSVPLAVCAGMVLARQERKLVLSGAFAVLLAGWTVSSLTVFRPRPYAPLRDAAEYLDQESATHPLSAYALGHGTDMAQIYFPALKEIRENAAKGLEDAILESRRTGQPLYVLLDHEGLNTALLPEGVAIVKDTARFEMVAAFPAIEPDYFLRIFRLLDQPPPPPSDPIPSPAPAPP